MPELSFKVTLKTVPDLLYEVSLTDNFVATLLLLPKTSELCELTLTTSSMSETAIISLEDKDNFSSAIETKEESLVPLLSSSSEIILLDKTASEG